MTPTARAVAYAGFGAVLGFSLAAALFWRPDHGASPREAMRVPTDLPPRGDAVSGDGPESEGVVFRPVSFSDLPRWPGADPRSGLAAFRRSCTAILKKDPSAPLTSARADMVAVEFYGTADTWRAACSELMDTDFDGAASARLWVEAHFEPYALIEDGAPASDLFTGYYEPELSGSRTRSPDFPWPALKPPADLVTVNLREFDKALPGDHLRGRLGGDNRLRPYPDRGEIERGFTDSADALVWLRDRADLFFLHIQGSGRIRLPAGDVMRIGYAADNGREYRSIGRELIRRGVFQAHEASLERIKTWLRQATPDARAALYAQNPSFIFFERRRIDDPALGPIGAMGVSLTSETSLAVDPKFHAYGPMAWFETERPRIDGPGSDPWTGLGVFQDTGSAIRGAGRVDVFYGWGEGAEKRAGRMKYPGRLWILTPKPATKASTGSPARD